MNAPMGFAPETITMNRADLATLMAEVVRSVQHQAALPEMYAFPEDIVAITKGTVPVNTIKYWRQRGWLRVTKLGRHCFVLPPDWQHFLENYPLLKRGKRV